MKLSTRGRYGIHTMFNLALNGENGPQSIKAIAERGGMPEAYLEQLIAGLKKAGLVTSTRGAQGGYMLARQPAQYTVGDILRLTEGTLVPVACAQNPAQCDRSADCATLPVWQGLSRVINEYLDGITLQDILDQHRERAIDDYVI